MIIDDLVRDHPKTHDLLRTAHCIRVPWHIWPDEQADIGWSEREWGEAQKLVPKDSINTQAISWKEIALPYDKLVIVSEFSDPCIWFVDVNRDTMNSRQFYPMSMTITVFNRLISGQWICLPNNYIVTREGALSTAHWNSIGIESQQMAAMWFRSTVAMLNYDLPIDKACEFLSRSWGSGQEDGETVDRRNIGILLTAIAAIMSCKNIVQHTIDAPRKLQQARLKRGLLPLYRYHVLKVQFSKKIQVKSLVNDTGESVAIHWVRGHFKRFTEDNKLFGKHIGLYWWQPHIAGKAERIVHKSYELEAK